LKKDVSERTVDELQLLDTSGDLIKALQQKADVRQKQKLRKQEVYFSFRNQ
jgi:hypothetical protein